MRDPAAASRLVAPAAVRLVDVDGGLPDFGLPRGGSGTPYRSLLLIARHGGRPIGSLVLDVPGNGRLDGAALRSVLDGGTAGERLARAPAASTGPRTNDRLVSVVITTCRNPGPLLRCVESVLDGTHQALEVIVVENRPGSSETRRMLEQRLPGESRLRYVEEPRRGLSSARNAGLAHASGEIVAVTDDDVVADPGWISRGLEAFDRVPDAGCVTGLILPLSLETPTQVLFEQYAAFGKGFDVQIFRQIDRPRQGPLFPYAAGQFGSGANLLLRTAAARRLAGFDRHLGTGTPAVGGEDLDLFIRLLQDRAAIVYEPAAIVWHEHPSGVRALRRQVYRYGVGLTAMLAKHLVCEPRRLDLLRAIPAGIVYGLAQGSRKNVQKPADYPAALNWLERAGMLVGPFAYTASRLGAWLTARP